MTSWFRGSGGGGGGGGGAAVLKTSLKNDFITTWL